MSRAVTELDALRAKLAAAEAERNEWRDDAVEVRDRWRETQNKLEAAEVERNEAIRGTARALRRLAVAEAVIAEAGQLADDMDACHGGAGPAIWEAIAAYEALRPPRRRSSRE